MSRKQCLTARVNCALLIAAFALLLALFSGNSISADDIYESGSCGPELTYAIYGPKGTGLNKVTGKGEMTNRPFYYTPRFSEVSLPDGLTSICDHAFEGAKNIKDITIPQGVKTIGFDAFRLCSSLESIEIPSSVTSIGFQAFYQCESLRNVTLNKGLKKITEFMFFSCTSLEELVIPDGLTEIEWRAFMYCSALKKVTIPRSVTTINDEAFFGCDALTVHGYAGSAAETFAKKNNIPFVPIQPVKVTGVKLDKTSTKMLTSASTLLPGQSDAAIALKATVQPANADNKKVKWSTSDRSIATVDASGKVRGLKAGTVTITATSEDGGKTASCKVQVMTRKEIALKAGSKYVFKSKLSNNYSMDVMYANYAKNSNVSLYATTPRRGAQILTVEKKVVNGKACYLFTRKNSTVGSRAITELKGKNLVFGTNKYTNWQLFRAYQFNDGTVQFINRGSNNAIAVVGGVAANRANVAPAKADLGNGQRWKCVIAG